MTEPTIGYWRWFYTNQGYPDYFAVDLSPDNGVTWANVDTLVDSHADWHAEEIRVRDYITPGPAVRVRFVVADLDGPSVVEGLVDDVSTYDAARVPLSVPPPAELAFSGPWPNPASGAQQLALAVPRMGDVRVDVVDVAGRTVRALHRGVAEAGTLRLLWDGRDDRGREVGAGLYWARARGVGGEATGKLVRVK